MNTIVTLYRDEDTCVIEPDTETYRHFLAHGWATHPKVLSEIVEENPPEPPADPVIPKTRAPRKSKTAH